MTIQSFRCPDTATIFGGGRSKRFGATVRPAIERKLAMLHAATTLDDLRSPPGNRLEALSSDRKGQHSIRVNDQFRVCFRWTAAGPEDVEVVDYHERSTSMKEGHLMSHVPKNRMRPVHPGEILREEYLAPLGLSANALAEALGVPANRVSAIVAGKRAVTADTALRLARAVATSPEFWLNLQTAHDLALAKRDDDPTVRAVRPVVGVKRAAP